MKIPKFVQFVASYLTISSTLAPLNIEKPNVVTFFGILTLFKFSQPENAYEGIEVILSGKFILSIVVLPANALSAIAVIA